MPRRLAITGLDRLDILDFALPPLDAGQVRVQTEYASGKHGTTLALLEQAQTGGYFDPERRLFVSNALGGLPPSLEAPWELGTVGVGIVETVGADVTRFRPGDRVFGRMDIREINICAQDRLWHLRDADPLDALCIEPAFVAFHCIRESNVRYGDRVAVVGLGALGLLAVRLAVDAGAELVLAIDPLPARRQLAAEFGAHLTLDPTQDDPALALGRLSGEFGVDVAVELSGNYTALHTAIRLARVGGTVCSAGFYQGDARGLWLGQEWHHNRLTMIVPHGCGWGHPPRDYPRWTDQRAYDCLAALIQSRRLAVPGLVNHMVDFEQAVHVLSDIRSRPNDVIKYAVRFSQSR